MRTLIALDLSYTNTGVAVFFDGAFQSQLSDTISTSPKSGTPIERADVVLKHVLQIADTVSRSQGKPHIFVEDYAFARAMNREKMGELGGVVKHGLWKAGYKVETLPIATIRKVVTGKGNAAKDIVMLSLLKNYGLTITQNDLADAAAVGITGDYVMQVEEDGTAILRLSAAVQDALKGFLKNK